MFPLWNLKSQELCSPGIGWELHQLSSRQSAWESTDHQSNSRQEREGFDDVLRHRDSAVSDQVNSSFQVYEPTRAFSFH